VENSEKGKRDSGIQKKKYTTPKLIVHGTIEKITGWGSGSWGDPLSGLFNFTRVPGSSATCGS